MKKFLVLGLVMISCLAFSTAAFAQKKTAVYVEGNISKEEKSMVNSAAMARLSGNKEYKQFERNETFLQSMLKEQDYQVSGEVPEKEIRNIGQRMGVDYVIVLVVNLLDNDSYNMSGRIINIVTGEVSKSVDQTRKIENFDDNILVAMTKNVVYRLIDKRSK